MNRNNIVYEALVTVSDQSNEMVNNSMCEMRVENEVEVVLYAESFVENIDTNRSPKFTDLEPPMQKIMKRKILMAEMLSLV